MDFGAAIFFTDYSMGPAELGRALEERGFGSLWAPEHSHIPLSRQSPFPAGGDLPKKYYDVMDPFVTLAAAATATTRLQVATGICLIVQRDPIQTAKEVATLDQISGGRFLFGIGAGWNAEEMADHGTEFKSRFKVMQERVEAMRAIWTKSKAEYTGEFVNFPPMMTWPKPAQKPHPPVIVGGAFPYGTRRAIAYGDGWVPHAQRPAYGDLINVLPQARAAHDRERARPGDAADHGLRRRREPRPDHALSRRGHRADRLQPAGREGGRGAAGPRPLRDDHPAGTRLSAGATVSANRRIDRSARSVAMPGRSINSITR